MADNKNRLTAREIIVSNKIQEARDKIIQDQLQLEFLKGFRTKIESKEIELKSSYFQEPYLSDLINRTEDGCSYDLSELKFYKNIRDIMETKRIDKAARKANIDMQKFPETINTGDLIKVVKTISTDGSVKVAKIKE